MRKLEGARTQTLQRTLDASQGLLYVVARPATAIERARMCAQGVCVCVCVRERERERRGECVYRVYSGNPYKIISKFIRYLLRSTHLLLTLRRRRA